MPGLIVVLERSQERPDPLVLERLERAMTRSESDTRSLQVDGPFASICGAEGPAPAGRASANGVHVVLASRLDARAELVAALSGGAPGLSAEAADAEILLRAYERWGSDLLQHVAGDFAFVLWDSNLRRLLAATDQFGVRPMFYAVAAERLLAGNLLAAIRDSGCVDRSLNEQVIGDVLSLGFSTDQSATIYSAIRRLPPGHCLTWCAGQCRVDRYWQIPHDRTPLLYRSSQEYAEHFREVFFRAVADRLPAAGPIGVLLSGGMDSTSVAAAARASLGVGGAARRMIGYTTVFRDYPEEEARFAAIVATHLGIASKHLVAEDFQRRALPDGPRWLPPEPDSIAELIPEAEAARELAREDGTILSGIGGDVLFAWGGPTVSEIVRSAGWRAPQTLAHHLLLFHHVPRTGLRSAIGRRVRRMPQFGPLWIDAEFSRRTELPGRLAAYRETTRRGGLESLVNPFWSHVASMGDPGQSGLTMGQAHPFLDTRLVDLVSRLPRPMLVDKRVLREAMTPHLPPEIIRRPKTPLGLATVASRRHPAVIMRHDALLQRVPALADYVNLDVLRRCIHSPAPQTAQALGWAENFGYWLAGTVDGTAARTHH